MKFGQLPTLQVVVRKGSFTEAAYEIGLTPSAVSQQMQQLEEYFGQPLFDRSARAARPTAFALEVLAAVDSALTAVQSLRDRRRPEVTGRLRVGVIGSVQLSHMAACLRHVRNRYPALDIVLVSENTSEGLLRALSASDIDAAVVAVPEGGVTRKIITDELASEPFAFISPRTPAGAGGMKLVVAELPWIRYNIKSSGGRMAAAFVRKQMPRAAARYDVLSRDVVLTMVSAGLGFSVIPKPRPSMLASNPVHLISLERKTRTRSIVLARRATDIDNRRIDALLSCLRDGFANPSPQA